MIRLIDELKVIPGVIGACIFNSQEGLKVTNLPVIFKPERLNVVGKHLAKLYSAGRMSFDDLTDITLNYDESVVVARELEKNTLIFAICDPSFNHNLLTMSFNLLQEEYKTGEFAAGPGEYPIPERERSEVKPSAQLPKKKASGPLKDLLEQMKNSLGKILGPMAGFVFDEVTEEWMELGDPDFSRIEELIEQINQEINDPGKIDDYRQQISSALKDFQRG